MSFDRGFDAYPGIEVRPVRLRKAVEGRPACNGCMAQLIRA
jgi:hypothetical protein